jgi:hypothetical protein
MGAAKEQLAAAEAMPKRILTKNEAPYPLSNSNGEGGLRSRREADHKRTPSEADAMKALAVAKESKAPRLKVSAGRLPAERPNR